MRHYAIEAAKLTVVYVATFLVATWWGWPRREASTIAFLVLMVRER